MEAGYTAEQTSRFQQMFAPVARRYRHHALAALIAIVGSISWILLLALVVKPSTSAWGYIVPFVICWIIGLVAIGSAPALVCPGCKERLDRGFGAHCPECASNGLQTGNWFRAPRCLSCGKYLRRHRARHYRIRACTHCGLMLDERGF
jgi:hypothetical protein